MGEPEIRISFNGGCDHSSTTDASVVSKNETLVAKLEMGVSFGILRDTKVWICDTGTSGHSINCINVASNQRGSGSASIGHVGEAAGRGKKTIDLPSTFVTKDGRGLKATLTEVSYLHQWRFA